MTRGEIPGFDEGAYDALTTLVSTAAAAILTARASPLTVTTKQDASPVTAADRAAEDVLLRGLERILPGICVVSEEAVERSPPERLPDMFVLVDPLDGTRELVAGREEFTVNIAVLSGGRPRVGLIAAPTQGRIWRGMEDRGAERLDLPPGAPAGDAERVPIRTRCCAGSELVAAVSRSHLDCRTETFLARLPITRRVTCGSAIKFCLIAEGLADVYPRFSTTRDWDVAAGDALVRAAGGLLTWPDGSSSSYGRIDTGLRIAAFIAWGDPSGPAKLGL